MNKAAQSLLAIFSLTIVLSSRFPVIALAAPFPQVGSEVKSAAGAGITQSRSAPALEYNPSNLRLVDRAEGKLDVSLLRINYRYLPLQEDQDPAVIALNAPPVTLGYSHPLVDSKLVLSVLAVPTGAGQELEVENLPIIVAGDVLLVSVSNKTVGYRISTGFAWSDDLYTLAVSLQYVYEDIITKLSSSEFGEEILSSKDRGSFLRPIFSANRLMFKGRLSADIVIKLPLEKNYDGENTSQLLNNSPAPVPSTKSVFEPFELGVGLRLSLNRIELFQEVIFHHFAAGRYKQNRGFRQDPDIAVDLNDVVTTHVGAKFSLSKSIDLMVAHGYYPTNIGQGLTRNPGSSEEEIISLGPNFGDFNAIDRSVAAFGMDYRSSALLYYNFGFQYTRGRRTIFSEQSGPGVYLLRFFEFSLGTTYRF